MKMLLKSLKVEKEIVNTEEVKPKRLLKGLKVNKEKEIVTEEKVKPTNKTLLGGLKKEKEIVTKEEVKEKTVAKEVKSNRDLESFVERQERIKKEKQNKVLNETFELKSNVRQKRFGYKETTTGTIYNYADIGIKDSMELHTTFNSCNKEEIKNLKGIDEALVMHLSEAYITFRNNKENPYYYNLGNMVERFIFTMNFDESLMENEKAFIKRLKENQADYVNIALDMKGTVKRFYNTSETELNPALKVAILSRIVYVKKDITFYEEFKESLNLLMYKADEEIFNKKAINKFSKDKCIYAVGTADTSLKYDEIDIPRELASKLCIRAGQTVILGRYPKNFVSLVVKVRNTPLSSYNGDSLKIHPMTALLLEGDFDGDGYVVTPDYNADHITVQEVADIMGKNLNPAKIICSNGDKEFGIVEFMKEWKNFTKEEMEDYITKGGKTISPKERFENAEKARYAENFTKSKTGLLGFLHEKGVEKYLINNKETLSNGSVDRIRSFEVLYALSRLPDIGVQAKNGSYKDIADELLMLILRINPKLIENLFDISEQKLEELQEKIEIEDKDSSSKDNILYKGKVISSNIF